MFTAKIVNSAGQMLTLTNNEPYFQLFNITGIDPPNATVNLLNVATIDGTVFNSSKLQTRNIVLYLRINGNVETNRHTLYRYFRVKEPCTFYYKNDTVDVKIDGYVESVSVPMFTNSEVMQISILCPDPYFKSVGSYTTTLAADAQTKITTHSQSAVGMTITIGIRTTVSNIIIQNTVTNKYIRFTNSQFYSGDTITINTRQGQKSIILTRSGVESNRIGDLAEGSTFLQLASGDNYFSYEGNSGAANQYMDVTVEYSDEYRGV